MAVIIAAGSDTLQLVEVNSVSNGSVLPFYGTVAKANNYFRYRLDADSWDAVDVATKTKALVMSTKAIDRLSYVGEQTEDEPLAFPRDFQTIVPVEVEHACYENALKLLDGVDPDTETDNLMTTSRAYGGVRTTFDRTSLGSHVVHGIASPTAWRLLAPFLNDAGALTLMRVS